MASGITNTIGKSKLQEKDVTITQNGTFQVAPDSGYDGMSKATIITNVPSTPTEEKTVALDMASGNQVITPTSGKVLSKVTITKPSTMLATNIKKDVNIGGVVGTYEGVILPTYNGLLRFASAPTISLSNSTLTITAVDNATSYAIYSDNTLLTTITTTSVDLSTLITTAGTYTIYAIAKATGYADSEKSNEVSYTVASGYSVSCSSYANKVDTALKTYYSTNNGSTWTEFTNAGILSNQTNQIKFRMTYPSSAASVPTITPPTISSVKLGMNIHHDLSLGGFDITSDNYTLTQNIDDIQYIES